MKVAFILRKPKPHFFSIENVFNDIYSILKNKVEIDRLYVPREKASYFDILLNLFYLIKQRADIYHITGEIYYSALVFRGRKSVVTIHDCNYARNTKTWKGKLIKLLWLDLPVRKCRYVIAISEQTRKDIIEFTGCDPSKIIVINNPVSENYQYTKKVFNALCPVILQVGTRWNKNLERVIEAIDGLNCKLIVIGGLTETQKHTLDRKSVNYSNYHNLSSEELLKVYHQADLLVFPSLSEGFGLPIIEAQALGIPVLTSNISPMQDVAGKGAVLADPYSIQSIKEGINKIIEDVNYRHLIIEHGLANAQKYKARNIADQYLCLYNKMMN